MGITVSGWDPAFFPDEDRTPADIVNLGCVVNVIEDPDDRTSCSPRPGTSPGSSSSCRRDSIGEATDAAVDFQGDGIVTGKHTFQKFHRRAHVSYLVCENFDRVAHPVLRSVLVADLHAFLEPARTAS